MSDESAEGARPRTRKAATAFRTISEVADDLQIPQHVLRFWETKFPQLKPLKRGGGRRYYRPEDITLLRRISDLLYTQGYTIKGVQRLLRDGGIEGISPEALADSEAELPPDEQDDATIAALREALQVLEGLAQELRLLTHRN
jgi:DNA-binding transcriptional MerR regulator